MSILPCVGCERAGNGFQRSLKGVNGADTGVRGVNSCRATCARLHRFLRDDPECHTRVRATELVLPPDLLERISDHNQQDGSRLDWQDIAGATPTYLDILSIEGLKLQERHLLLYRYSDGLSHREIADIFGISEQASWKRLERIKRKAKPYLTKYKSIK